MLTKKIKLTLSFAIAATMALGGTLANPAAASDNILFGIVPQQSATRLAQVWVPFMNRLSEETGMNIRFATTKDIPSFEKCLAKGAYELAYMNPYHFTVFNEISGYVAIARQAEKRLHGLIVVRKDSPFQELEDLDGKMMAFPSPAAFGASVLARAEMRARGIAHLPQYVNSHDSVYRAVAAGIYPAGGGVKRTFSGISEDLRAQLRILYTTEKYTPHAFAALGSMPADVVRKIASAMLRIGSSDEKIMKSLGMKAFAAARDDDWDDVRRLGLTSEQTEIADEGKIKCRFD